MSNPAPYAGRPVLVGEVLYDRFPDGSSVLGGAPFNVAWHLHGFGLNPLLASRVGDDDAGHRGLEAMRGIGMDTSAIQIDPDRSTGCVLIEESVPGQHRFVIPPDQAWDRLDPAPLLARLRDTRPDLLYHGSLLARSAGGLNAILTLRKAFAAPVFVDINLREPWWTRETIDTLLTGARWIKLNDAELQEIETPASDEAQAAIKLRSRSGCERLYVTRGADSTLVVDADGPHEEPVPRVTGIVDTVGAGDAYSATILFGLLHDWPPTLACRRAAQFAAAVCRMRGATTPDRGLYEETLRRWTS